MNLLKQADLQEGNHYWIMLNQYHEWRLGYIGLDSDDQKWLHLIGVEKPIEIKHLTECTAIEIERPVSITKPIPKESGIYVHRAKPE